MGKLFVEYPLAKTFQEAEAHWKAGGELWREYPDECPEHGYGRNDQGCDCCFMIEELYEDYPTPEDQQLVDVDEKIHLVPTATMSIPDPIDKPARTIIRMREVLVRHNKSILYKRAKGIVA